MLIFDFRDQGRSPSILDFSPVGHDVEAAIKFLKSRGYDRVVCMGASMGGSGCLAASVNHTLEGFVNLSGPMNIPGSNLVTTENLADLEIPKPFLISEGDTIQDWPMFVSDFVDMYEISAEPKELIEYPCQAHGSGLLREDFGEGVLNKLLDFLSGLFTSE